MPELLPRLDYVIYYELQTDPCASPSNPFIRWYKNWKVTRSAYLMMPIYSCDISALCFQSEVVVHTNMDSVQCFNLNGEEIETNVTKKKSAILDVLDSFLVSSASKQVKVIGIDIECHLKQDSDKTKCATLHLCDGSSCLIIQLLHMDSIPVSLLNFLHLPDYTFVGVGIKDDLYKLDDEYGIRCKNAVDLGPLAATVMKMPRLSGCGIDELTRVVNNLDLRRHRPLTAVFKDWGQYRLSKKLAKLATVNVYSYYKVGTKLLEPST